MHQIKFSHEYTKMPKGYEKSHLLEVLIANTEDLSISFVNYDTFYRMGFYPLPKGKVIILLLYTRSDTEPNQLWTTIRRHTPEKEAYYRSIRGQQVEIVINDGKQEKAHNKSSPYDITQTVQ